MQNILEIRDIRFAWSRKVPPLIQINEWSLMAGERVFLYGPSGSGKSTLLNLLAGIITPQQGTIQVLGESLPQLSSRKRDNFRAKHIGVIFQQFNLVPYLSILDNIKLAQHFAHTKESKLSTSTDFIRHLLARLSLDENLLSQKAANLSVGQQQRVAIIRALINHPQLLIADEPTSALDAALRDEFIRLLLECAEENNSTVVFVSHDQSLATYFDKKMDLLTLNSP